MELDDERSDVSRSDADIAAALLDGLDGDQRSAVTAQESLLAVIAGAGSGKTTVLTRRIAYRLATGVADERHVLVVTFTRQAAGELRRHLHRFGLRSGITAGTFHAIAFALLRQRWADTGRQPMALLKSRTSLLSELANPVGRGQRRSSSTQHHLPGQHNQHGPSGIDVGVVLGEIDWAKARLVTPGRYAAAAKSAGRRPAVASDIVVELFQSYEREKKRRRVVDFDDLLAHCLDELTNDTAFADATRWRYRHLFVDEFQDVNPLQHGLLEAIRGSRPDMCVVGDPRQSIYGWNGSEPALLEQIGEGYPGIRIVRLDRNYRSTPQIVDAASSVLRAGTPAVAGPATVDAGDRHTAHDRIADHAPTAMRPDGPAVSWRAAVDEAGEAAIIAETVKRLRSPGSRWAATAVLTRTNAQLNPIAQVLTSSGVPVRSSAKWVTREAPDIAQLLGDVKSIPDARQLAAWSGDLEEAPIGGIVTPARHALAAEIRTFLSEAGGGRSRIDGRAFLEWRVLAHDDDDPVDGVELLTFHAAKGRQWRSVIVAGVEAGLVPHYTAGTEPQRREEARLLYVACTRAEDALMVTWTQERGGRVTGPSPLIAAYAASPDHGLVRLPRPQLPHRHPPKVHNPILDSLQQWRARTARAAALPEAFVCSDDTLAAIAAARPETADDLGHIEGMSPLAVARFGPRILVAVHSARAG